MEPSSIGLILLLLGFVFTLFIPGYLIIELFFGELLLIQKLPAYFLISIFISTYIVYLIGLATGFSRFSVLLYILIFGILFFVFLVKKRVKTKINLDFIKEDGVILFLSLGIFILFLVALYPAIFSFNNGYFVMSAVNWQDTAMHQSIIQTISQGNFPPQAPYFSGQPLNYYYFIDLHSAILQTLYNDFFPRILVYDNPFFVMIFFLSVYVLAFDFLKRRLAAILAGLLATFNGNFLYYKFIRDIFDANGQSTNLLITIKEVIANHSYTLDYGKLMQMVPMADYFLQNRPMMVGLPAITLITFLLKKGFETSRDKYLLLAGLLTAMLVKFQLFAFGASILIFILSWLYFTSQNIKKRISQLGCYFIPMIIFIILVYLLFGNSNYAIAAFLANFRFGAWDETKDLYWYIIFPFANFGIPFSLSLVFTLLLILNRGKLARNLKFLLVLSSFLMLIPYTVYFTIYDGDMLKFFHILLIPLSIISGFILQKIWQFPHLGPIIAIVLILAASFNSLLTLGWSFYNKNAGYSEADYQAGIWIRNNTPPKSVFLTMPTVHSAVSDIGGRLRVLSYTVWPYSHGFNQGSDNVFSREADIKSIYINPYDALNLKKVASKYNIDFIYIGPEEKNSFPSLEKELTLQPFLMKVYNLKGIQIYKIL